jgi:hypothetical protein
MAWYHPDKPNDLCAEAEAVFDDLARAQDQGLLTFTFYPSDKYSVFNSFLIRFANHIQSRNKDVFFAYLKHNYNIFNSYFTIDKRELRVFVVFNEKTLNVEE